MAFLTNRTITPELMDRDDVSTEDLNRSFRFIRAVNRLLSGSRAVIYHLNQWAKSWAPESRIEILDIGTGCADIPLAITRWAARRKLQIHITAVDRHAGTLEHARRQVADHPDITLLQADALDLPFKAGQFDYVLASMFLHHLTDLEVLTALRSMDNLARRGIIWNDLTRSRRALIWSHLLTLPCSHIVRHDATVSVRAGFTRAEVLDLRNRVDLNYTRHTPFFGHRFTLAGDRTLNK